MQIELAQTTTDDGVRLDGVVLSPERRKAMPLDALLLVHGTTGNFYGGLMASWLGYFRDADYVVASFNTRGHDIVSRAAPGRTIGTAYEILDECRLDLDAAISWLAGAGYERIGLLGGSMGAVKVIYYQAHVQDPRVAAVVAVSPVRLSRSYYLNTEAAEPYQRYYDEARSLLEAGQPNALLRITEEVVPGQGIFGASAWLEKYGHEKYNIVSYVHQVACPLLIVAGTLETHPRLRDCARDAFESVRTRKDCRLVLVEGGSHGVPEFREELANTVDQWASETIQTNVEPSVVS